MNEKLCTPIPCPSFEEVELEVLAVCTCLGNLEPGDLFALGCPVHDPQETE